MKRSVVSCVMAALILAGCSGDTSKPAAPQGSTVLIIPSFQAAPELDRQVKTGEWDEALVINSTFAIQDGTAASGNYPFELRLGHNETFLFGWIVVRDALPNPFSGNPYPKYGHVVDVFLDTRFAPKLEGWESLRRGTFIEGTTSTDRGYWDGSDWVLHLDREPGDRSWDGERPRSGTWFRGWRTNSDINIEFYIPLKTPQGERNDFNVDPGDIFRMCLLFEVPGVASPDARGFLDAPRDAFPGDEYAPNNHYDPTTWLWLKLA